MRLVSFTQDDWLLVCASIKQKIEKLQKSDLHVTVMNYTNCREYPEEVSSVNAR